MCAWEWYPNNRGIITGIILAGFGFGAFFYGFISTAIVNPNNLKPLA
jgi:OFA family oxalate/formate antiporter-like MFS transporter